MCECDAWDEVKDVSVTDAALGNFSVPHECKEKKVEIILEKEVG